MAAQNFDKSLELKNVFKSPTNKNLHTKLADIAILSTTKIYTIHIITHVKIINKLKNKKLY